MFNPLKLFSKLVKSGNEKELDRIKRLVLKINNLEKKYADLKDSDFPEETKKLINDVNSGKNLNYFGNK